MNAVRVTGAFLGVLLLGSLALADSGETDCKSSWPWHRCKSTTLSSPAPPADPVAPEAPYVIGVEETLRISVWQEPDLSETVPVRPDGMISLPLLNDVQAAGLTAMQLAASITEKLRQYVDHPRVTVVVARMKAQRIYLVGEVLHSGPLNLTANMTVLQALATAGLTPFANTKKIYVLRVVSGVEQKFPVNYKPLVKGKPSTQNITLKPEDMIVVP